MRPAVYLFGLAAIGTGIVDLVWGAFDTDHQPLQAWGDHVPGSHLFAYIVGVLLVAGGVAVFSERSRRFGASVLAVIYLVFAIFWLPRLYTAPHFLGQYPRVYIGVLAGICSNIIVVCAAMIVSGSATTATRWIFGLCTIIFGLQHWTNLNGPNNIEMVPSWMPFGQIFWVGLTGTAFILAGIAILIRIADVLAARLLALMFFVFSVVTLIPGLIAFPREEVNWGGNIYEFIAVASAWILADWLVARREHMQQ
ncbi:MAG TPA: hypothetical protein VME66_11890 [Candidatus Acidoferrales bacterium]|nr:hypothetical protein [Candidatus Acidoferrales bacterium]